MARRRVLLIHNPVAGRRRRRRLRRVVARLRERGLEVRVRTTAAPGDAGRWAAEACGATPRFDIVAAAGGDGTVNEVANGLLKGAASNASSTGKAPILAFVPLGTANVLAHEIALPRRPEAIADMIAAGRSRPLHLGRIESGRAFVLMAGIGIDAWAVAAVNPVRKRHLGIIAYGTAALGALFRFPFHPYRVVLGQGDSSECEERAAYSVVVTKARCYGGPFVIADAADIFAEGFNVVMLTRPGRWRLLRVAVALSIGRLHWLRDVETRKAATVSILGPPGDPVQADGDLLGQLPAHISQESTAIDLIVPARS